MKMKMKIKLHSIEAHEHLIAELQKMHEAVKPIAEKNHCLPQHNGLFFGKIRTHQEAIDKLRSHSSEARRYSIHAHNLFKMDFTDEDFNRFYQNITRD